MSRPVYIVCGGTGGHLAPGIATAQRFIEKNIPVELIISEKEVDSRLLQGYAEIPYRRAKGSAFGLHPVTLVKFLFNSTLGFMGSISLIRSRRPAALVAFGGYLSFSYVLAARLFRIPVVLHEANRKVGKSIRLLSSMATRIYLPEGVTLNKVKPGRVAHSGMPLRREIQHIKKSLIREKLGIPADAQVLTVIGGSQGAVALNDWVKESYKALVDDGIWIYLISGPGKQVLPERQILKSGRGNEVQIRTFAFHNAPYELFSASDIVISRAGAGTIAELTQCLTPSILIPYPHAADQHQLENANDLERRGGCIVVNQEAIGTLYGEVQDFIYNDALLAKMRKNLSHLIIEDPAETIADYVVSEHMQDQLNLSGKEAIG